MDVIKPNDDDDVWCDEQDPFDKANPHISTILPIQSRYEGDNFDVNDSGSCSKHGRISDIIGCVTDDKIECVCELCEIIISIKQHNKDMDDVITPNE